MPRRRASLRPGRGGTVLVLALAMALWVASTLGFMHRVVHVPGAGPAVLAAASSRAVPRDLDARARVGVAALFGHHGGEDDCRLYDQLAGGAAVVAIPVVMLPIVLPMARFHFFLGEAVARWVALFDARGPPATR